MATSTTPACKELATAPQAAKEYSGTCNAASPCELNERKRKGVSPPGREVCVTTFPKRLRYPCLSSECVACSRAQAQEAPSTASEQQVISGWVSRTEQVTPENALPHASADSAEDVEVVPSHRIILPRQFEDYRREGDEGALTDDDLIESITTILENICSINNGRIPIPDRQSLGRVPYRSASYPDGSSSIFFSLQRPSVQMRYYVARLVKYLHVSKSVFVVALIYLDRVHAADEFLALTDLNVHRLITTALAVASKFLEDEVHRNSTVCRIAGIPSLSEMNLLETQFLRRIHWNCSVTVDSYELYRSNVFKTRLSTMSEICSSSCGESHSEGQSASTSEASSDGGTQLQQTLSEEFGEEVSTSALTSLS